MLWGKYSKNKTTKTKAQLTLLKQASEAILKLVPTGLWFPTQLLKCMLSGVQAFLILLCSPKALSTG